MSAQKIPFRHIAVEGPIGVGKTSLVQLLADRGNLGGVEVVKPQVVFYLSDKQSADVSHKTDSPPSSGFPAFSGNFVPGPGDQKTWARNACSFGTFNFLDYF